MKVLLVLALVGCGPSLTKLTSNRHYREAVCAAHDGSSDDRDHVRRSLARDADVRLHVALVDEVQLSRVVGPDGRDLARRLQLARILLVSNTLPVDGVTASVDLVGDRDSITSPVSWETLAAATTESLPPKRTDSTYLTGGNVLRGLGVFFSFGLSLPFTRFRSQIIEVDAPHSEYQRMAPLATALRDAMRDDGCRPRHGRGGGVGLACTFYVVLDPTASDRDVHLEVDLRYRAKREQRDEPCLVDQHASIPLGRMRELDRRIGRMFAGGSRMRRLSELTLD